MSDLNRYVLPDQEVDTEVFVAPSPEARWLVRRFGPLFAPADGRGDLLSRALGVILVAPFTQLTFVSYDLEVFLFEVFHEKLWSRLGHFIFMITVNLAMMTGLAQFTLGPHPIEHGLHLTSLNLGTAYAALLLLWYLAMASQRRMWLWWVVMVPVVGSLYVAANAWYGATFTLDPAAHTALAPTPLLANPWLWAVGSAFMITLSHIPEERLPPRVCEEKRWISVAQYFFGPPNNPTTLRDKAIRLTRMVLQSVWGTIDEWWASPRLMPYNILMVLFRLGYRPDDYAELMAWVERARASGNPALDYVGIGGGAFLRQPQVDTQPEHSEQRGARSTG